VADIQLTDGGRLAAAHPTGGTNKLLGLMGFAQMSAGERSLGLH
jgi:hypothetical protein